MKRWGVYLVALGLQLPAALGASAQNGTWRASSSTAMAITGDIAITDEKLAIYFNVFTIAEIRALTAAELSAMFNTEISAASPAGRGNLYRLVVPATKKFLHKNTLCGSEDTQWMVTLAQGKTLHVAFFSGTKMPVFTMDAIQNSTDLCGTYLYSR